MTREQVTTGGSAAGQGPQNTAVEELAERLGAIQGVSEDTAEFIARNWQKILGAMTVTVLAVLVFGLYRKNVERREGEASQRFQLAAEGFLGTAKMSDPGSNGADANNSGEQVDKLRAARDGFEFLSKSYSDGAYGKLSNLYLAELSKREGKLDLVEDQVKKFSYQQYRSIKEAQSVADVTKSDLFDELAALKFARTLLDSVEAAKKTEAREYLTGLAYGGKFVNAEALLALFRSAANEDEKKAAFKVADSLLSKRPLLRESVTNTLSAEGIAIPVK